MRICTVSDIHISNDNRYFQVNVPDGDILLVAGDLTASGTPAQLARFNQWLGMQPHQFKLVTAGNHDWELERNPSFARGLITNGTYLENESAVVNGLEVWMSPISPTFFNWAFNRDRGAEIDRYWQMIPDTADIIVTHTPAYGILDKTVSGEHVGCKDLLRALKHVKPKLFVCGHIHESAGREVLKHDDGSETVCINAAQLNERYEPNGNKQVIEL